MHNCCQPAMCLGFHTYLNKAVVFVSTLGLTDIWSATSRLKKALKLNHCCLWRYENSLKRWHFVLYILHPLVVVKTVLTYGPFDDMNFNNSSTKQRSKSYRFDSTVFFCGVWKENIFVLCLCDNLWRHRVFDAAKIFARSALAFDSDRHAARRIVVFDTYRVTLLFSQCLLPLIYSI